MEIIELSSYLDVEKLEIAKRHILPKLIKEYKLENFNIEFHDEAIRKIIEEYTREAGVRNLEREIASVLRKYAKETIQAFDKKYKRLPSDNDLNKTLLDDPRFIKAIAKTKNVIDTQTIGRLLKAPRFKKKNGDTESKIGVATGLAWTSIGGDTLPIEVSIMNGSEKLTLTGKLGDVMKESARAALTFVRSNSEKLGVPEGFYKRKEIHIHIPEGAIPKDGPSAGITMTMALISAAANKPLRGDVAMTGEITLRGNVLPIGGLNEKLLAAKRMGIKTIIIPEDNLSDIEDVNPTIKDGLIIAPVKTIIEALPIAFADKKNRGKRQKQEPVRLLRKQKNERL
jgi:ATP-dependent Lon protease